MMVEEYELKRQQEAGLWRTAFALLSGGDVDWKHEMPLPLIDRATSQNDNKIPLEDRQALLEKYAKAK
jgi:hypothetical protein